MSESDGSTAVAHVPLRDLEALRDEIDVMRLVIYGVVHGPEECVPEALEREVNRLADQVASLVGEADVTGGAPPA